MKTCIIGTGAICGNHISALKKCGIEIAALCDIEREKALSVAQKYEINAPVYTDYRQMIDEVRPDCVHVCTPHYLHEEMICYALKRNVNVLSEKPICINFEQLQKIDEAVKNSTARLCICFQNRFLPANVEAGRALAGSKIFGASGSVIWNRDEKYYASGEWRGKWNTEGGGALINQAIHTFDLMLCALGAPKFVYAKMANKHLKNVIEVEDEMTVELAYDGFKAIFFATTAANGSYPVTINYLTDNGVVTTSGDSLYINNQPVVTTSGGATIGKAVWGVGHEMLIADFYDAIAEGRECKCDYEKCRLTMQTVLFAYESAKTGQKQYF